MNKCSHASCNYTSIYSTTELIPTPADFNIDFGGGDGVDFGGEDTYMLTQPYLPLMLFSLD